jgi:hypothetical protein
MITPSVVRTAWKQWYTPQKQKSGHHFIYLEDYVIQRQINKQSWLNAEQIEKDNYPESEKITYLLKFSTLFIDICLVDSVQTNHMCHITSTQLRDYFFPVKVFSSLSPC